MNRCIQPTPCAPMGRVIIYTAIAMMKRIKFRESKLIPLGINLPSTYQSCHESQSWLSLHIVTIQSNHISTHPVLCLLFSWFVLIMARSNNFTTCLALKDLGNNEFESVYPPQRMAHPVEMGYGGYALTVAFKAAFLSVPKGYHLYSMLGNYLGPSSTDRPLLASVSMVRQTRTFATRRLEISQKLNNGTKRVCMVATADFHIKEPASLLEYSRPPSKSYSHWKHCPTDQETFERLVDEGNIDRKIYDAYVKDFTIMADNFEMRPCPEGVFAQNILGMAKHIPHTQDTLPMTSRTTADWFRSREQLATPMDQLANLIFYSDAALAFTPLSYSHSWFEDVTAVSSLEFALRFFKSADLLDMNRWHLREMSTSVGGEARTYGETWIWDDEGRAVACMSQQSILRPRKGEKERL